MDFLDFSLLQRLKTISESTEEIEIYVKNSISPACDSILRRSSSTDFDTLVDKRMVGDIQLADYYSWAENLLYQNTSSTNVAVLAAYCLEAEPIKETIDFYFLRSAKDLGLSVPKNDKESRQNYIENKYKDQFEQLIFSITEDELSYIAEADRGWKYEEHLRELRKLIFQYRGIVQDDQGWCPCEVINLIHYYCQGGHEREYAICNCIMAQSFTVGYVFWMDEPQFMIERVKTQLDRLPHNLQEIVLGCVDLAARVNVVRTAY